jgi:hypothetical protein
MVVMVSGLMRMIVRMVVTVIVAVVVMPVLMIVEAMGGMVAVRVVVRRDDHSRALYTRPHDALRGDTDVVSQATERFYKRYRIDAQVDQRGQGHVT